MTKSTLLLFLGFLSLLFLPGCGRHGQEGEVVLHIQGDGGRKLAFYEISAETGALFLDSVRLRQGEGLLRVPENGNGMYVLRGGKEENLIVLLLTPGERFLLEAHFDSLLPTARLSPLPEAHPARTRGTGRSGGTSPGKDAEQGHLREKPDPANAPADSPALAALFYQQEANRAEKEIGRINRLWIENRYRVSHADSLYLSCARSIDTLMRQLRRTARELCRMQPGTLLPVLIANKQVGNRPVFDLEDPAQTEFLLACAREMQETRKGNPHAERFLFNMERIRSFQQQEQLRQMEKNEQETRTDPSRKPASRTAPHSRTNLPDNPPKHPGN